jgi:hypothetical protein
MSDIEVRRRLDFLGFTESDASVLSSLRKWVEGISSKFAWEFYERSFRDAGFVEVVQRNKGTRDRLESAQAGYCVDLFRGCYPTSAYVEMRQGIGALHARLGVEPGYYTTSYQTTTYCFR